MFAGAACENEMNASGSIIVLFHIRLCVIEERQSTAMTREQKDADDWNAQLEQ